jgi:hypothetical protein
MHELAMGGHTTKAQKGKKAPFLFYQQLNN